MKEKDYINVSDLAYIRAARWILAHVVPDNSDVVDKEEFINVMKQLDVWVQKLEAKIKT